MLWSQFDTEILECNRSDHFVNDYWPTMYVHYGNTGYEVSRLQSKDTFAAFKVESFQKMGNWDF